MRAKGVITLTLDGPGAAAAVARATAVDNPRRFTRQHVIGRRLVFEAEGESLGSLCEALDDWLRCASAGVEAARRAR